MENNIKVGSITLDTLFSKYKLIIPEYQRPYVWTEREINKLLFQFSEHIERKDDKPHFYLGSIVLHKDGNDYNIIDGQQRITTLQILDLIKNNRSDPITYNNPTSLKHIKENYQYFKLKEQELKLIDFSLINVTLVITNNEDMAYNFFETLNTGGKRLRGTDILKAHHLRCIKENDERNSYALKWGKKNKKTLKR